VVIWTQRTLESAACPDCRSAACVKKFFEEEPGETLRIVADNSMLFKKVIEDGAEAKLIQLREIDDDWLGTLGAVALGDFGGDWLAIGDNPIDDAARRVPLNDAEMIGKRVTGGFAGLGHEVGDINARGLRMSDGPRDLGNEQIWEDAGIERARSEKNEIGLLDGVEGFRERANVARGKREFLNGNAAGGDACFTVDGAAVFQRSDEMNVRKGRGKYAAPDGENLAADANSLAKISSNVSQRGEKEIAKVVAGKATPRLEAILKEAAEQGLILRKRNHAVADVAGREDAVLAAKAAGAAAVIGDGDNSGEVGDRPLAGGMLVVAADDVFLEAAKESGETGAPSKSDDAEATNEGLRFMRTFFQRRSL
jgi:hypothetical protein